MIIFLRKIPVNTRYSDIVEFIEPALDGGLFKHSGRINKIEILVLRDVQLKTLEFHALITVEPDAVGFRALKSLKGKRFKDRLLIVRQYFHRSWHNDPRQHYQALAPDVAEKRVSDRRRGKNLERVQDITEYFSSAGDFVRKG